MRMRFPAVAGCEIFRTAREPCPESGLCIKGELGAKIASRLAVVMATPYRVDRRLNDLSHGDRMPINMDPRLAGRAWITPDRQIIAGQYGTWTITYEVGEY